MKKLLIFIILALAIGCGKEPQECKCWYFQYSHTEFPQNDFMYRIVSQCSGHEQLYHNDSNIPNRQVHCFNEPLKYE